METFTTPQIIAPHIQNWQVNSQYHLLKQGEHTTNNVVTNRSVLTNNMISKTFSTTVNTHYEFLLDDITTYTPPTSPGGPGGGISSFATNYDYTVRVYKSNSTTAFYTTQFNLSNATRVINFATDSTTSQIRIEISKGMAMIQGYSKYVDNLKLRKFTGNTSVYNTNYSNMSLTANALDGWSPDNWTTNSATVDQAAGQYRLVATGSGATAKVQREFTALPNQEHRFQYNLSLLNGGSTTVRVEQKVNGVYQYLATQQTQTTSGTYELSFVPSETDIRISVSGTSRYALNNLYLDRDQIDTLVATYALSRGYRYGYQGSEKDNEVKGSGNSYTTHFRLLDPRLGRWLSIDPKAAKFCFESPYVSMGNRPITHNDIMGDEWDKEEDKVVADNMCEQYEANRDLYQSTVDKYSRMKEDLLKDGKWNYVKYRKYEIAQARAEIGVREMQDAMDELRTMERSDQCFTFTKLDPNSKMAYTYMNEDGVINIEYMNLPNLSHELKHAYQGLMGDIKYAKELAAGKQAYEIDLYDEVEAYRRQYYFKPSSVSGLSSRTKGIQVIDGKEVEVQIELRIKSSMDIDEKWVKGIYYFDAEGIIQRPYNKIPMNSDKNKIIRIY